MVNDIYNCLLHGSSAKRCPTSVSPYTVVFVNDRKKIPEKYYKIRQLVVSNSGERKKHTDLSLLCRADIAPGIVILLTWQREDIALEIVILLT